MGRIAAAAAIAIGTLLSMTPAASAAEDVDVYSDDLGVRGCLTYTHTGIKYEYKLWHHTGHHQDSRLNCTKYPNDINLPEDTKVYLQVCLQKEKGTTLKYCDTDTGET